MAKTVVLVKYPLMKVMAPLAVVVLAVGVALFSMSKERDPMSLLPWLGGFAALLAVPFLVRRKERYDVILPTDRLKEADRKELEGVLATLEKQLEKGELSQDRYAKARNRVLKAMKK